MPALQPPNGIVPNFVNPPSQANQPRIAIYVSMPIMVFVLALRIYTRLRVTRALGADDYLCIVSAISVCAFCGIVLSMLGHPLGLHQWDVPLIKITETFSKVYCSSTRFPARCLYTQRSFTGICMYAVSAIWVKSTLLVLYLRIFRPSRRANIMIWLGLVTIAVFYLCCIVVNAVQCVPRRGEVGGWLSPTALARCSQPELDLSVAQGVFSAVSDLYVLSIPMHLVFALRLALLRKIGVSALFFTGFIILELNVGIICSCMPVVFILFKRVKLRSSYIAFLSYFRTRNRSGRTAGSDNDPRVVPVGEDRLPAVPKPTLTGLRSFIKRVQRSQPGRTTRPTEMSTYSEINSMNDDYHAQLKARK
ncbi:hypothetical protein GQ43DRAFT_497190 [Delitschia confertaspora ATCC 74209]|uniref:Rhodopsin domain-containing protein n=1 Tax=Delitschia confertaspora ATCC 74209 TaxID=1513339 RepID=A0A9P4JD32_9PLEO|nr:hypothetical protein GQ43DRAFT_497190 [Delitschia confertaspora ATCC 74209]